jgi:hypothetical protein
MTKTTVVFPVVLVAADLICLLKNFYKRLIIRRNRENKNYTSRINSFECELLARHVFSAGNALYD